MNSHNCVKTEFCQDSCQTAEAVTPIFNKIFGAYKAFCIIFDNFINGMPLWCLTGNQIAQGAPKKTSYGYTPVPLAVKKDEDPSLSWRLFRGKIGVKYHSNAPHLWQNDKSPL